MYHSLNNIGRHVDSSVAVQIGKWQHVAFTLSGPIGTIYIDGQQTVQGTL
jgi:hypothetical protein